MTNTELQDLIDNPRETLAVELKRWLDLNDKRNRANVARQICALTNHGGGYLIFGFNNDGSVDMSGADLARYTADTFSGIAKAYLNPPPQCITTVETSTAGNQHVIVQVPPHRTSPVCAIADGPQDNKGNPQGIVSGTHYHRATGPESAPVNTQAAWQPIIHRCVVNEREALLSSLAAIIRLPQAHGEIQAIEPVDRLRRWHQQNHSEYMEMLHERKQNWPVRIEDNHYQLSYELKPPGKAISGSSLIEELGRVSSEVRDTVWTGWSMFYPFNRPEIAPYFYLIQSGGKDVEVVEANLVGRLVSPNSVPDFWRISRDGLATIIRPYREDRDNGQQSPRELAPGTWLYPYILVREIAEVLRHARALAKLFPKAETVALCGTWYGLKDRRIDSPTAIAFNPDRVARVPTRTIQGEWSLPDLLDQWPEIASSLASDITRLFDGLEIQPEWVRSQIDKFRSP
jgi:hypothetical protein